MTNGLLKTEIELFEHDYNIELVPIFENDLFHLTHGRCWYCGNTLDLQTWTIDHVVPLAEGGSYEIDNLAPACRRCNRIKSANDIEYFRLDLYHRFICENFTTRQITWLKAHGCKFEDYGKFWGEYRGLFLPLHKYVPRRRLPVNYELGRYGNLDPAP